MIKEYFPAQIASRIPIVHPIKDPATFRTSMLNFQQEAEMLANFDHVWSKYSAVPQYSGTQCPMMVRHLTLASKVHLSLGSSDAMRFVFQPWQLFFLILAGWINRQQQDIIEFQTAQIRILMEKMGRKRILLTDDQRRILAVNGKTLGRKTLTELTTIVTPDTILRWHRRLIAAKWD